MKSSILFSVLLFVAGTSIHPASSQPVTFSNVAPSLGIDHPIEGGFMGGGVSFVDFDGDGLDDLTIPSEEGTPTYFYRNNGVGFDRLFLIPGTEESNTALWADFDNDGDRDLFLGQYMASNKLYENLGNNNLVDITVAAGISEDAWATTAACWGDYDNDGWLDLFIANYSGENGLGPLPDLLYRNEGDGTFINMATTAGVADSTRHPLAASFIDYNNDGWADLFIANDKVEGNILYQNTGNGQFTDVSNEAGIDKRMNAMSAAVGDYDDNGFLDIYVTNTHEGNGLFRNNGDGTFTEVARALGVEVEKICWGASFFDYDNDADLDLFVAVDRPFPENGNVLFSNNGDGTFVEIDQPGFEHDSSYSYGSAIGDFNNDGFSDIAVLNISPSSFGLWESSGGLNNWLKVTLRGTTSNNEGIGSIVRITAAGKSYIRHTAMCGTEYLAQNSSVMTIGVGEVSTVDMLEVFWPSGRVTTLEDLETNQHISVPESGATGIGEQGLPERVKLDQNYPNPFNPETEIGYQVTQARWVTISVFDASGRQVATIVNEFKSPGRYEITWGGGEQATGVYFYRMRTGGEVITRKMLLLR